MVSDSGQGLSFDAGEENLTVLAGHLGEFLDAWGSGGAAPELKVFLPEEEGELRRMTLVELIKIDLEYRLNGDNLPKRLQDYLTEFPELTQGDAGIPADLVYEEYHLRKQAGLAVDPEDYMNEFPDQARELRCLLGLAEPYESTGLFPAKSNRHLQDLQVGDELDDFHLLARLGKGAFAHVFLARQNSMQRLVALKVSADHSTEPQTLAQLDHDSIVRVFDQRSLPENGMRLLYMQYVAGGTLQSVLEEFRRTSEEKKSEEKPSGGLVLKSIDRTLEERGESRPVDSTTRSMLKSFSWGETVCWIGSKLAKALDYAHGRGILHRDIKPANVLVSSEGRPKLADFNISFSSKLDGVSPAAYFGGSLAYMSPEQLEACSPSHERRPDSLDGGSDLYSLAVLLWELLSGARPFRDEKVSGGWSKTIEAMIERRGRGIDAEAESQWPPDTPPGLLRVLKKCLAADREDRWKTGAQLAQQLDLCRRRRAQNIIYPQPNSPIRRLRPFSVIALGLAAIVPHIAAGVFAKTYNEGTTMRDPEAFGKVLLVFNSLAFPIAFLCGLIPLLLILRASRALQTESLTLSRQQSARLLCLNIGHIFAVIGMALWSLAGVVYPACVWQMTGSMPIEDAAHFFGSHVLCGLIATPYAFFAVTYFCIRVLYPRLMDQGLFHRDDVAHLQRLVRRSGIYLAAAASAPMLGVLAVLFVNIQSQKQQLALQVFATAGLFGFGAVFLIWRQMQGDVEALAEAAHAET